MRGQLRHEDARKRRPNEGRYLSTMMTLPRIAGSILAQMFLTGLAQLWMGRRTV
jgi:hypothetical protein